MSVKQSIFANYFTKINKNTAKAVYNFKAPHLELETNSKRQYTIGKFKAGIVTW